MVPKYMFLSKGSKRKGSEKNESKRKLSRTCMGLGRNISMKSFQKELLFLEKKELFPNIYLKGRLLPGDSKML